MNTRNQGRALIALLVLSAFLLGLNKIGDVDAWLHLSHGKLIWSLKGMPDTEPFTYPAFGMPYYYSSWLFGVLCYLTYSAFNVYGLVLLKAAVVMTVFYVMLKDALRPYNNYVVSVLIITASLMLTNYRFVLRPDIFFMLFLSFSIFSLNAYLYDDKKYIYVLPIVHLFWANIHSSITVMSVPFLAFIVGGLLQRYLEKRGLDFDRTPNSGQLKTVLGIFIASFGATLLNPYYAEQYFYGSHFLSSDWFMEHIKELRPITEGSMTLYAITSVVLASFLLIRRKISLIHFLLLLPFIYLTFNALRFIFIIALVGFPIMARNISASIASKGGRSSKSLMVIAAVLVIVSSGYMVAKADKKIGFGFDFSSEPMGAVEYLDKNEIYGRVLNHFQFGQYIIWDSYPKRHVYVDGRGLLPVDLLEKMMAFTTSSEVLDDLYETYGFDYIIAGYLNEEKDVYSLTADPMWAMVYWDDVSLVFLRRNVKYEGIIARDEFRIIRPEASPLRLLDRAGDPAYLTGLINDIERNVLETGSVRGHVFMGYACLAHGSLEEAREHLELAVSTKPEDANAHYGLGLLYEQLGDAETAGSHFRIARSNSINTELEQKADNALRRISHRTSG